MDSIFAVGASIIIFALGASIGSFINVVVYRVPAKLSILWPPSRCPHCLHQLGKTENVPVFGWLWLRGRCRHCHSPISPRYPLVEATTGFLFLLISLTPGTTVEIVGNMAFFSWLLALSLIDFDTMTLPSALTKSGLVVGLAFQAAGGLLPEWRSDLGATSLMGGIVGAVVGIWLLDIIRWLGSVVFQKEAMGDGDPKLAAMMGAWLGWQHLLLGCFLACAAGAFIGGGAIALGLQSRHKPFPFGPFLALGAAIASLWGEPIVQAYLNLFFPLR